MKYGLIGEHLGHSFSAPIHERITGEPYELKELAPEDLDGFMREKDFMAINVTIPYKQAVIPYLDELSPRARAIGAVNTVLRRSDGSLLGDNTDYAGFVWTEGIDNIVDFFVHRLFNSLFFRTVVGVVFEEV